MKRLLKHILQSLLLFFCAIAFAQDSYIQIKSAPGVSVFLDGDFKGVTDSEFEGLIIKSVQPGTYQLKFALDGFNPQSERITVKPGEVYIYTVKKFVPVVKITQKGNKIAQETRDLSSQITLSTGTLRVQSLPVGIQVGIPDLGIDSPKNQDEWIGQDMPVGTYQVYFKWKSKSMTDVVTIQKEETTDLFVDFIDMKIKNEGNPAAVVVAEQKVTQQPETEGIQAPEEPEAPLATSGISDLVRYNLVGRVKTVDRFIYTFDTRNTRSQKVVTSILSSKDLKNNKYVKSTKKISQVYQPNGNRLLDTEAEFGTDGRVRVMYNKADKASSTHFWQYQYDELGNRVAWGYYELGSNSIPKLVREVDQSFDGSRLIKRTTREDKQVTVETFQYLPNGQTAQIRKESNRGYPRTTNTRFRSYKFDETGNWIERHVFVDDFLVLIEKREYTYYTE